MREILFRGKRADNGKWTYGYLFCIWERTYLCWGTTNNVPNMKEVIPETVGQYTGLIDRNGKRIFEGDIVRLTDEYNEIEWTAVVWTAVVVFGNPNGEYNWGWQLRAIGEFDENKGILFWVDREDFRAYCEIIGNIHDNPELMKGGNNNG